MVRLVVGDRGFMWGQRTQLGTVTNTILLSGEDMHLYFCSSSFTFVSFWIFADFMSLICYNLVVVVWFLLVVDDFRFASLWMRRVGIVLLKNGWRVLFCDNVVVVVFFKVDKSGLVIEWWRWGMYVNGCVSLKWRWWCYFDWYEGEVYGRLVKGDFKIEWGWEYDGL